GLRLNEVARKQRPFHAPETPPPLAFTWPPRHAGAGGSVPRPTVCKIQRLTTLHWLQLHYFARLQTLGQREHRNEKEKNERGYCRGSVYRGAGSDEASLGSTES
ncbi:hypothetical protein KI387_027965, partial [Taxus chinensis]